MLHLADGRHVARWRDPIGGASTQQSLDVLGLRSDNARRDWARKKSVQLADLRQAVALGTATAVRTNLRQAVAEYLAGVAHKATREAKRLPLETLADRMEQAGCQDVAGIAGPLLVKVWRDWVTSPKNPRAPQTRNRWLAVSGSFLRWARRRGMAPLLTLEGIADACERVAVQVDAPEFLRPVEVRQVLEAALAYDREPTRWRARRKVSTFVLGLLLSGCRLRELANLVAGEVRDDGIHLSADRTKTRRARVVTFAESPILGDLLRAMIPEGAKPDAPVFPPALLWSWDAALRRMVERFGSPRFTAHTLRRTAGTYLTCAPSIYGGASAFMSAKRLGHGVDVAERHYVGHLTLPATAKTLEAALGVEDLCSAIVEEAKR